jgi:hypothetical protein
MKNALLIAVLCTLVLFINSCEKCYKCHNICKTCTEQHTDTVLTAQVCSDVFGEIYFNQYLDSLQNELGYTCADAPATVNEDFCGSKTGNQLELISRKDGGYVCTPK